MAPYGAWEVEQTKVRSSEVTSNSKKASKSRTKRARAVISIEKSKQSVLEQWLQAKSRTKCMLAQWFRPKSWTTSVLEQWFWAKSRTQSMLEEQFWARSRTKLAPAVISSEKSKKISFSELLSSRCQLSSPNCYTNLIFNISKYQNVGQHVIIIY